MISVAVVISVVAAVYDRRRFIDARRAPLPSSVIRVHLWLIHAAKNF
jgi:hypothetical protein